MAVIKMLTVGKAGYALNGGGCKQGHQDCRIARGVLEVSWSLQPSIT